MSQSRALLCVFLMAGAATSALPETWHILPDGTGDAPTIQAGLDACADGDTVLVAPGTYFENIVWPATGGIKLTSESGPEITFIDGGGIDRVIGCLDVDSLTVIEGFTIQHGYAYRGAGIAVENSALTIRNNIIRENEVFDHPDWVDGGAGIGCRHSTVKILDNVITRNTCAATGVNGGGGIGINDYSGAIVVNGNTIVDNEAISGAGIMITNASAPIISHNVIANNEAWTSGGGIATKSESTANVFDNEISGNTAGIAGGGIRSLVGDMSVYTRNTVSGNTAPEGAGVSCANGSQAQITHCQIVANNGDGVTCDSNATPLINFNDIMGNSGYGVRNLFSWTTIDATMNYWGDESGPYHDTANPSGSGDEVSDDVDFDPWLTDVITGVVQAGQSEPCGGLSAYPNPFNPRTTIAFDLPERSTVNLALFDTSGRLVATLLTNAVMEIGRHEVVWGGKDQRGRDVASGVYFYRLEASSQVAHGRMTLVR